MQEAAEVITERQAKASSSLAAAANNAPQDGWLQALEVAHNLNVAPSALLPHKNAWAKRQENAKGALAAASKADPFSSENFSAAVREVGPFQVSMSLAWVSLPALTAVYFSLLNCLKQQ
jgi:hypothetical protein